MGSLLTSRGGDETDDGESQEPDTTLRSLALNEQLLLSCYVCYEEASPGEGQGEGRRVRHPGGRCEEAYCSRGV